MVEDKVLEVWAKSRNLGGSSYVKGISQTMAETKYYKLKV